MIFGEHMDIERIQLEGKIVSFEFKDDIFSQSKLLWIVKHIWILVRLTKWLTWWWSCLCGSANTKCYTRGVLRHQVGEKCLKVAPKRLQQLLSLASIFNKSLIPLSCPNTRQTFPTPTSMFFSGCESRIIIIRQITNLYSYITCTTLSLQTYQNDGRNWKWSAKWSGAETE